MEDKFAKFLEESKDIVDSKEPTGDISFDWVIKNKDLKSLEEGIPLMNFSEEAGKRNKEMEFRVFIYFFTINIALFSKKKRRLSEESQKRSITTTI